MQLRIDAFSGCCDRVETPRVRRRSTRPLNSVGLFIAVALLVAMAATGSAQAVGQEADAAGAAEQGAGPKRPPYRGTIYVAPDIYRDGDPSAFDSLAYRGRGARKMFDRRAGRRVENEAYLFEATFTDGLTLELRGNPEFTRARCEDLARCYMIAFGQIPTELRRGVTSFDLHDGDRPFGGGGGNVLVHAGMGERYRRDGILTETLFHETVHATIDRRWARDAEWLAAQASDAAFVSEYAQQHPRREDLAETLLLSIALDQRPGRLPEGVAEVLRATIPHRQAFFETRLRWAIDPTGD
jgi:hypothetical protein